MGILNNVWEKQKYLSVGDEICVVILGTKNFYKTKVTRIGKEIGNEVKDLPKILWSDRIPKPGRLKGVIYFIPHESSKNTSWGFVKGFIDRLEEHE